MRRKVEVANLGLSLSGTGHVAKKSLRAKISEGDKSVVVEVRFPLGILETLPEPEEWIERYFKSRALPRDKEVIDIQSV